jgi:hypothetical protein
VRQVGEVLEEQLGVDEEAGGDEVEVLDDLGVAAPQQDRAADDQQATRISQAADQQAAGVGGEAQRARSGVCTRRSWTAIVAHATAGRGRLPSGRATALNR